MPQRLIKKNPKEEIFQRKTGIFIKVLIPLLLLGLPVVILSYSDFLARLLLLYLPGETLERMPLFIRDIEFQTKLILILTLVMALFLGLLISRHFSKSLGRISDGLKKILAGTLDFKIKIESRDEIGEVSYFLNKLTENLKEAKIKLSEREEELEEKSQELTEKIKTLEISTTEAEKARLATLNILEDVEEARGELEKEKKRIENIILSFVDGLMVLKDSEILLLNPSAEEILGIKAKDVVGKPLNLLLKYPSLKILSQFLGKKKGQAIFREELIFQKPERTFQITAVFLGAGQDLMILHDVTREKLIEQMKTEFVSLAAHQLRTPLSAIKWTLRMILDGDLGKITKEQKDFLQKTYLSNERMIELINDLLNVARIEEGRYLYQLIPAQFEDIVQAVIDSYSEQIQRKKIKSQFQKPKEKLPKLQLDEEKISLAVQNIIDNAIRYTQPGGQVTVSLRRANMKIELSVKDTGIGIPQDQKDRVFTKFFRGANVIRMDTEGAGLGLFITKNIIEAHGGKIWFESEENKGTTFYFTLPLKKT